MNDREACIGCNLISGIGNARFVKLCEVAGSPARIPELDRSDLMQIPGIGAMLAEKIVSFDWDAEVSRELAVAERGGVRIFTRYDAGYPEILRHIYDPPLVLYVRGNLPEFGDKSVAVVGSRRVSRYGEEMTAMLAREAAAAGFTVVSGLALGVDSIAHKAVVQASGITVGVIGAGLLHLHPKENIPLAREIIETGGAVISEFPFDFPVSRQNFPRRNRIVAGLCRGTIVVEAGVESGALITARLALESGRDVFAVPGRVDNPQARGCHKLIKEGAALIENFDDVLTAWNYGLLPGFADDEEKSADYPEFSDLSENEAAVCRLLKDGEASFDSIYAALGIDAGMLSSLLTKLELKLLISQDSSKIYRLNLH
jgi:DNA processing protein